MMTPLFSYHSIRADKARIGASIGRGWVVVLTITAVIMMLFGLALVSLGHAEGWAFVGAAAIPAMIIEWKKGELSDLEPDVQATTIDSVLAGDVLGMLSKHVTPYEIASVVGRVYTGQFFAVRFGIGTRFLQEISSKDTHDTEQVWRHARDIQQSLELPLISGGVLVLALIKTYPQHETLLAHLQLDFDDLIDGIRWQRDVQKLIAHRDGPMRTGGIARDWSFGWIPSLSRFGQNISSDIANGGLLSVDVEAHQQVINQLVMSLSDKGPGSAALIGNDGVGKTHIVHALAERLLDGTITIPSELKYRQIFMLDAASLVSEAPGRGELEALVMRLLGEAYSAKNIIICLDNAQLFFQDGLGSADLSTVLLPILEAGRLPIIVNMDEQQYLQITRRNPQLAHALSRIIVAPTSEADTISVLQNQLISIEFKYHVTYMYQSLKEIFRLSERYIHDLSMPGRAVTLLESAAQYADAGLVTVSSVQQAIEKTMDVKVGVASGDAEREKLLQLESLIHERMINQTRAVSVVSDALRRARAGVRSQDRPIGTFLFVGPTGVGKTELAKALADVYFGGEDRMIRMDMNEFVSSDDVARLIADASDDSMSLTARVMKQPFSVILLDEIEKAHPNVLTTFLQVLDEGILRDIKGREVSFRDAIIIATSNAGSDRIREQIERGLDIVQFEDQFVDELIKSNQFKPEFLNRFDEIVMFRPLNKPELLQVVDLILQSVNKTLALQKVSVVVDDDAKSYLVDAGYDPRLGARPMRRIVQRAVENTVAKQVLSGVVGPGGTVTITLDQVQAIVSSKSQADTIAADAAA
jgi:ATP-dependent Clp protease ATP-binding subunit ClpC